MIVKISPTKTNLFRTKRTLSLCKEGYRLLDEKRKILLMQISSLTQTIEKIKKDVEDSLASAYSAAERAIISMGKLNVERIISGIDIDIELDITERKLMGVNISSISLGLKEKPPYFSPAGVNQAIDEAILFMKEAIKHICVLAEKRTALERLEQEFMKTTKKVNALEKIHIPYYSEVVKFITDRLDEESREAFATLKEIKKKLASKGT